MLKIILVDDEPMVRAGIKKMLNDSGRWQVIGEALNGRQAIRQIEQLKPDVVISDIRMPEFDGLQLLQSVHDIHPDLLVILLTGYPDFDYAQQAVRFGAFDYIVKPSRAQEIMVVLEKAEGAILRKRNERQYAVDFQLKLDTYQACVTEKLLFDLLHGEEIDRGLYDIPMFNSTQKITVMAWSSSSIASPKEYFERFFHSASNKQSIMAFHEQNGDWTVVICWSDSVTDQQRREKLSNLADSFHDHMSRYGHDWGLGISETGGLEESSKIYDQSKLALYWTITDQRVIFYSDLLNASLSNRIVPLELQFSLLKAVQAGDQGEAMRQYGQMKRRLEQFNLERVTRDVLQFHEQLMTAVTRINMSADLKLSEHNPLISKFGSKREAVDWLEQQILIYLERSDQSNHIRMDYLVRRVVRILHEKYNSDIKLAECASAVCISPNYLSSLFKQEMGISFSDYLSQIRIHKAKSLLLQGNSKVYEVAQQLGYVDGRHFSQVFKKATGTTPGEFRQLNGIASDH